MLSERARGTRVDPFGRTEMRRLERALPDEFRDAMATTYGSLTSANLDDAVAIAELPDMVRGFEDLEIRRIGEYRERLKTALGKYSSPRD